jgi:hypothetical protein
VPSARLLIIWGTFVRESVLTSRPIVAGRPKQLLDRVGHSAGRRLGLEMSGSDTATMTRPHVPTSRGAGNDEHLPATAAIDSRCSPAPSPSLKAADRRWRVAVKAGRAKRWRHRYRRAARGSRARSLPVTHTGTPRQGTHSATSYERAETELWQTSFALTNACGDYREKPRARHRRPSLVLVTQKPRRNQSQSAILMKTTSPIAAASVRQRRFRT